MMMPVTFFESLLALLAIAILLLQVSRRLAIPYPTMLAAAGVVLALVPGAPQHRPRPAHGARALHRAGAGRRGVRLPCRHGPAAVAAAVRACGRGRAAERRRSRVARRRARRAAALCSARTRRDRSAARCGGRDRHPAQREHAAPLGRRAQGREPAERRDRAAPVQRRHRVPQPWRRWTSTLALQTRPRGAGRHSARHRARQAAALRHAVRHRHARRQPVRIRGRDRRLDPRRAAAPFRGALPRRVRDDDRAHRQPRRPGRGSASTASPSGARPCSCSTCSPSC